jgi:AP-2 complex subunit alpha
MDQFQLLHSKSQFCVAPTRSLLLSTYIKWVNVFPEIKPQLVNIFERYRHVLDAELQQRACEFYTLASRPDDDELLQHVCEEMPPFPPRVSALLGRLNQKHGDTEDKRVWVHGGKEANLERDLVRLKTLIENKAASTENGSHSQPDDILGSLAGLDLSTPSATVNGGPNSEEQTPRLTKGPNIDRWFEKLVGKTEGVLYEDVQIQIGIKSRYQGHIGQMAIYIGNKVSVPLTSLTTTVYTNKPDALSLSFTKIPPSTIMPLSQTQQLLHIECKKFFAEAPILTVSFLAGSHQTVSVRLPILLTKFVEHVKLGSAEFFERWKLIGGPPRESQSIFPINLTTNGQLDLARHRQIVSGHRFNVLDDIDTNPSNLVGAGILHMSSDGKVGCLLRVEPNKEAKVCELAFRE